jgi:hypothetical protein
MAVFVSSVFWLTLRLMDRALKIDFNDDVFPIIQSDPMAAALYAAGRLIALAILYSPILRVIL